MEKQDAGVWEEVGVRGEGLLSAETLSEGEKAHLIGKRLCSLA